MIFIYRSDQRIGVDLHGVIDHNVSLFKGILNEFVKMGKEVWIVSGPPTIEIEAELVKHGIKHGEHYHFIASVVDHLKEQGANMWLDNRKTWWAEDKDWWSAKGNICIKNGISILIDDQIAYQAGMPKDGSIRLLIYDKHGYLSKEGDSK